MGIDYKAVNSITKQYFTSPPGYGSHADSLCDPTNSFAHMFVFSYISEGNNWQIVNDCESGNNDFAIYHNATQKNGYRDITNLLYKLYKKYYQPEAQQENE